MSKVNELAEKSAQNYAGPNAAFDPTWIMIFAELIMQITDLFGACGGDAVRTQSVCNNPSFLQRRLLRIRTRRTLGWREYRKNGRKIEKALLKTGKDLSLEDVEELMNE